MVKLEILERGYQALRRGIDPETSAEKFDTIELLNPEDVRNLILDVTDERVEIFSADGQNPFIIKVLLKKTDEEIEPGMEFEGVRLYTGGIEGEAVTPINKHTKVTFENQEDELTIMAKVEIPEIEE